MEDTPPPTRDALAADPNLRAKVAETIVRTALQEPHVRRQVEKQRPVPFATWLWALAHSGRAVLASVLDKGF
jgi:hypothetical protein